MYTAVFLRSVRRLLVTTNVVTSLPILVTLMKEALRSSETSVLVTAVKPSNLTKKLSHSLYLTKQLSQSISLISELSCSEHHVTARAESTVSLL
jgi:hypothetical protein